MATGTLSPDAKQTFLDTNGKPLASGKLYTYLAGTSTPAATYTDVALSVANANPIILDTAGRAVIFLVPGASYKYILQDSTGASIWTQDNIVGSPSSAAGVDVTGTAGEALTAGQVVYLSDGSGSKTAGQWFKADNANIYSSVTNDIGMVQSSILLAASGTIRLQGQVTGLSALTIGALYYIGTGGAITLTAPAANRRVLGQADTTSSLVLTPTNLNGSPGTGFLRGNGNVTVLASADLPGMCISTNMETTGRFATGSQINGGGGNTFGTTGVQIASSATINSSSGIKWTLGEANENMITNSPRVSGRIGLTTKGTDAQVFFGLGVITVSGTLLTMTDSHAGFKITWAASGVASLFATQADTVETASSALTTIVAGDALELILQVNGTTSVDYYWRKNGAALSAATNLATHVPTAIVSQVQAVICNSNIASASTVTVAGMSYQR